MKKLKECEMWCYRRILNISHIPNTSATKTKQRARNTRQSKTTKTRTTSQEIRADTAYSRGRSLEGEALVEEETPDF